MSLDPNIILQQTTKPFDPIENAQRIYALKNLALQNQQQQRALDTQMQLRNLAQSSDIATPEGRMALARGVAQFDPVAGVGMAQKNALAEQEFARARHETGSAELAAKKAQIEDLNSFRESQASIMQAAKSRLAKIQDPAQQQQILSSMNSALDANAQVHGHYQDRQGPPEQWDLSKLDQKLNENMGLKNQLDEAHKAVEDEYKKTTMSGLKAESPIGKVMADLKAGRISDADARAMIKKETHIAPNVTQIAMAAGGANFDPAKPLSPALESQAKATAETGVRLTPSSRNPNAWLTNARADYLAQEAGGTVGQSKVQFKTKEEANKYFTTGAGASAFRQQETILHHVEVFKQIANALENGNVQLANKLGAKLGAQFGSDKATNYRMAGQILSAEVGKYLSGSQSTKEERAELAELIPVFSSPEQFRGGLETLHRLVQGQRESWQRQKDAALAGKPADYTTKNSEKSPKMGDVEDGYKFLGGDPRLQSSWKKVQ